jgi:hypothetical protein
MERKVTGFTPGPPQVNVVGHVGAVPDACLRAVEGGYGRAAELGHSLVTPDRYRAIVRDSDRPRRCDDELVPGPFWRVQFPTVAVLSWRLARMNQKKKKFL